MKKKILFSTIFAFAIGLMFSFSCVFATNTNPVDGVRNVVGGAENVMEGTAMGITNGIRNATGAMTNGMDNMTNNGSRYTATRTSTAFAEPTLLGINMTTWTWIIMAIAAAGIITLIWSYTRQEGKNYTSYDE